MTIALDKVAYARLLGEIQPKVIETEAENELYLAEVSQLMALGENLTLEQEQLLRLLVILIEEFEDKHYRLKAASPNEILNELVSDREVDIKNLIPIFGSQETALEILSGKQNISKLQAKLLGEFFHLSPALFID